MSDRAFQLMVDSIGAWLKSSLGLKQIARDVDDIKRRSITIQASMLEVNQAIASQSERIRNLEKNLMSQGAQVLQAAQDIGVKVGELAVLQATTFTTLSTEADEIKALLEADDPDVTTALEKLAGVKTGLDEAIVNQGKIKDTAAGLVPGIPTPTEPTEPTQPLPTPAPLPEVPGDVELPVEVTVPDSGIEDAPALDLE